MSVQISSNLLCKILTYYPKRQKCKEKKKENIVPMSEVHRFITECLIKECVKKEKASIFADSLVAADYRGIYSHGLNRLEHYLNDIREKICDANADPVVTMQCASVASVSGNNGLGSVIGMFCMDLAINKAKETGIGMVVCNGSNHFGINRFYTERALQQGLIGLAFTNTSPVMVPSCAKHVSLGTNPLSIAAPAECGDSLIIDMATTAVSVGKIEMYRRRKQKIPLGWALDEHGKQTTDPEVAMKNRRLMPLGGDGNYKGTALAIMVECLSGLLADSAYGPHVRLWGQRPPRPANLGHGFIAIDPQKFPSGFRSRLSDLLNYIRNLERAEPERPVFVPGDIERNVKNKIDAQGGIIYTTSDLEMVEKLSKKLGVKPIKFL